MFDRNIIEFSCPQEYYGNLPEPVEAKRQLPEWFKKIPPFNGKDQNGFDGMTAKKCLPMLDGMTLGFIIRLGGDVQVISNHDCSQIKAESRAESPLQFVQHHSFDQVKSSKWPIPRQDPVKFLNYWKIKTKPGWSCYFTAVPNEIDPPFRCLTAVVDTDKYHDTFINFPAIWLKPDYDAMLPAGTPLVQCIPFKRTNYSYKVRAETEKEMQKRDKIGKDQALRNHVYTHELRETR